MEETTMNQFRYDGEMPPEIASYFPIAGRPKRTLMNPKPKAKQTIPAPTYALPDAPEILGVLMVAGGFWLLAYLILTGDADSVNGVRFARVLIVIGLGYAGFVMRKVYQYGKETPGVT